MSKKIVLPSSYITADTIVALDKADRKNKVVLFALLVTGGLFLFLFSVLIVSCVRLVV